MLFNTVKFQFESYNFVIYFRKFHTIVEFFPILTSKPVD